MDDTQPQFLDVGSGPDRRRIAYLRQPARHPEKPSLMFLSGFKSEMRAIKAGAVAQWVGPRASVVTGGVGCLVATAWIAARTPALRHYPRSFIDATERGRLRSMVR